MYKKSLSALLFTLFILSLATYSLAAEPQQTSNLVENNTVNTDLPIDNNDHPGESPTITGPSIEDLANLKFDGSFIWPCDNKYVTSTMKQRWGRWHKGIDTAASYENVYAAASGYAYPLENPGGYGHYIILFHGDGWATLYGNLSSSYISNGQYVEQGKVIALSGNSGSSTGPHLHFEIRKATSLESFFSAQYYNPLDYLPSGYTILDGSNETDDSDIDKEEQQSSTESNIPPTTDENHSNTFTYKIIDGANQTHEIKNEKNLIIKTNGDISKLTELRVNTKAMDKKHYKITAGSTIAELESSFLDTLSPATYKLTFIYTDGEVSTNFIIKEAKVDTKNEEVKISTEDTKSIVKQDISEKIENIPSNPKTDDNIYLWINLMGLSIFGLYWIKKK